MEMFTVPVIENTLNIDVKYEDVQEHSKTGLDEVD